ncbi:MAG: hypothetical protein ABI537_15020 [Casimicrobiaceae bacterium]
MIASPSQSRFSLSEGWVGPFPEADFVICSGSDCHSWTLPQARWYFEHEIVALPRADLAVAGFARGVAASDDVAQWATQRNIGATADHPPLVWVGSAATLRGAQLSSDGTRIDAGAGSWRFSTVPKIPLNRSYFDATSVAYLCARTLKVRGTHNGGTFTARTTWPEEFRLDDAVSTQATPRTADALRQLIRTQPHGGATSPFAATVLWERNPGARSWQGQPVLALLLNGAQGDDDEAHGGHFALVTGRVGEAGAIGDWLANNFYTLDSFSEKDIIAAPTPLDNYLADLNSGQAWYRPSYLLVAILSDERTTTHLQSALGRVYNQFYRHQLVYEHATMNCAGISIDVLHALGWKVPTRGPTSRLLAALSLPWNALRQRSVDKAIQAYDYLTEDRTRLFPAAAFEDIGADMLGLASGRCQRPLGSLESMLVQDIEAIAWLRVPQLPSSRAWGDYPVDTAWEYTRRVPRSPADRKIIPVPPRLLPTLLRDSDLLPAPRRQGEYAIVAWAVLSVVGIPWLLWRAWRRRRARAT